MPSPTIRIDYLKHPHFASHFIDYQKWRSVYEGGDQFIARYLKKFSSRETESDFLARKQMTYIPAHAKAAITDIRNAIFQRMPDVIRRDGPTSYQQAIAGEGYGVDLNGASIDSWMGKYILPELMVMSKVGIFVDRQRTVGAVTLADQLPSPYLYYFQIEDIRSWHYNEAGELDAVLLREHNSTVDENTGLVSSQQSRFRLMRLTPEGVVVRFWDVGTKTNVGAPSFVEAIDDEQLLEMDRIPFVILDIGQSLLADVANHQIALLNMASSDVNFVIKSNFPFYTEQTPRGLDLNMMRPGGQDDGTAAGAAKAGVKKINVGVVQGRGYAVGTDRPGFIHPSPEPLKASMEKQQQMKNEIRELINLALSNVSPSRASAESKLLDNQGLEAGLSYIGLELQRAEREIAKFWAMYEGNAIAPAHVKYPDNYQLKTDKDRRQEASELDDLKPTTPSMTFKKELCKEIARVTLGPKVPVAVMEKIEAEIERAAVVETSSETVRNDMEAGLLSLETGADLRGYPKGEVERAKKDHAERLKRIQEAQTSPQDKMAARGLPDLDPDPKSGSSEREEALDTTQQDTTADRSRGEGKDA